MTNEPEFGWFDYTSSPPKYVMVSGAEADRIRASLAQAVGLQSGATGVQVVDAMFETAATLVAYDFEPEGVDLRSLLDKASVPEPREIYLVSDPLSTLFRLSTSDIGRDLSNVFQLGGVDVMILDPDLGWALFLMHYGVVCFKRLSDR
ncbi:MAG TPA: hypothetical protein VLS93_01230 [Anaeromyxobacteraceae bacterium]|nr:hypothetical protein [Anaeromyxobacteraceae bacterium]